MPNVAAIQQLERRLLELGWPAAHAELQVREIADHHEDLKVAALEDGLSEADAETRANQLLGEPDALAERLTYVLRQSSWWGRHRIIGFCLLPPLGVFAASLFGLFGVLGLLRLCFSASEWTVLADLGPEFRLIVLGVQGACYAGTAGVAVLFCWLARRSIAGMRWAIAACGACSLQSYFGYCRIAPHAVSIGYTFAPDWIAAAIPLLVASGALGLQKQISRPPITDPRGGCLPFSGESIGPVNSFKFGSRLNSWKRLLGFPTYWALAALLALLVSLSLLMNQEYHRVKAEAAAKGELLTHIWPAERAAVEQEIKAHQRPSSAFRGWTIDLVPYVNTTLRDDTGFPAHAAPQFVGASGNNLDEFPLGTHTFGSVPFAVQGKIQLMGRGLLRFNKAFPSRVRGIHIARRCATLRLLHGAAFVSLTNSAAAVKVAALILHYSNGSQCELGIFSGKHVLDWWGPIMKTEIPAYQRQTTAPGTELAWVGGNAPIRVLRPDWSLRLYESSFENPRPDLEITTVDYVSTLTEVAPFLLGLTLE